MSDQLDVRIITPEKVVFRNHVGSVVLPGTLGMMEILPDHVAMFSTIKPGEVELKRDGKIVIFACGPGLVEVCANSVTILVDSAAGSEEIDPKEAERMIAEAEDKLKNLSSEDEEQRFAFETQLAAARARIEVYERISNEPEAAKGFTRIKMEPVGKAENKHD